VVDRRGRKVEGIEIPISRKIYSRYFRQWEEKLITVTVEAGGCCSL
jgi:hypothetical protein